MKINLRKINRNKVFNIILVIIWIALSLYCAYDANVAFQNEKMIGIGGYLYDESGKVIGLWDGLVDADLPYVMYPFYLIKYMLMGMPIWWSLLFWGIGIYLLIPYIYLRFVGVGK